MNIGQIAGVDLSSAVASLDGVERGSRIVVAMSGGVDSSVAAALLKQQGYDVVGVTLQLYDHGVAAGRKGSCCAGRDIHDARRVADAIGAPHYVLDYEARFRSAVIDPFADSYLGGETPIPCVACNQAIKFGDLAATARQLGAAALVTGHYVAWRRTATGPALFRATDADRDQSYFLFATRASDLEFLRFPLGGLAKPAVRKLAQAMRLPVAAKPDSQDICFVPSGRYTDVIERLRPGAAEPGEIQHIDGRVLGRHPGILHFTVGQRRGLGIADGEPLYVVSLNAGTRRVIVGPRAALLTRLLILRDVNWLDPGAIDMFAHSGAEVHARVRSTRAPQPAILARRDGRMEVILSEGEHGIARGQACVLYAHGAAGAQLLGGGWIAATAGSSVSQQDDARVTTPSLVGNA
ncbi:MAG: tRNA 2-thiouridine(34) synthase MnmA [Hyphomicrobiaceae bacterium]|nr:tRNA 2-thiouridine(34) synthase MnmA [Hyphomicrobiaceae bacterium]